MARLRLRRHVRGPSRRRIPVEPASRYHSEAFIRSFRWTPAPRAVIDEDEARAWLAAVREAPDATAQRLHAKWRAAVGWIANGGSDAVRRMLVDDDGVDYAAYVRDVFLAENVAEIVDTWYEPGCCGDEPRGEACPVEVRVGRRWLWLDAGQYAARIRALARSVRPIFRAVADAIGSPRFGSSPRRTRGVVARLLGGGGCMVRWAVRDVADLCLGGAIDVPGLISVSNPARAERACRQLAVQYPDARPAAPWPVPRDAAIEAYAATYGEPPLPDADGYTAALLRRLRVTAREDGPDALPPRAEIAALCGVDAPRALKVYDALRRPARAQATTTPRPP